MKNPAILKPAIFQTLLAMCFLVVALLLGQKILWVFDVGLWVIAFIAWLKYFKIRLLPNWIGFNFATITIGLFLFMGFTQLYPGAIVRTLDTVYAKPPYSDIKLKKIEAGNTMEQVRQLLGEPLAIENLDFIHGMIFTEGENRLDPTVAKYHAISGGGNKPFLTIWFSEKDVVNYVSNSDYTKMKKSELIGLKKEIILEIFGKPTDALYIPETIVWSYTKLSESSQMGKNGSMNIRRVYFNTSGKVVTAQIDKGSAYNIYSGIYE